MYRRSAITSASADPDALACYAARAPEEAALEPEKRLSCNPPRSTPQIGVPRTGKHGIPIMRGTEPLKIEGPPTYPSPNTDGAVNCSPSFRVGPQRLFASREHDGQVCKGRVYWVALFPRSPIQEGRTRAGRRKMPGDLTMQGLEETLRLDQTPDGARHHSLPHVSVKGESRVDLVADGRALGVSPRPGGARLTDQVQPYFHFMREVPL